MFKLNLEFFQADELQIDDEFSRALSPLGHLKGLLDEAFIQASSLDGERYKFDHCICVM